MGQVRTVLGDISSEGVGPVMMHEHVLFNIVPPGVVGDRDAPIQMSDRWQADYRSNENPANAHQTNSAIAGSELVAYAADGGSMIVDQSVAGLARDAVGLADAARKSGVHVVAAAGTYTVPFLDAQTLEMDQDALARLFTREIENGLDGTDIRAGLIGEIGCSWPLHDFERSALVAAAHAQRATGASISVHPGRDLQACTEILDVLENAGADLTRVILCHMDRTHPDGTGIQSLLDRGATVEWDFFGIEQSYYWMGDTELPTDLDRLRLIHKFADRGHAEQITISHDICTKTRLRHWGGHGYGHILRNVRQLMDRLGFSNVLISALIRNNPLRLLTLTEGTA
ncbi:MAG: aryldialkylphosphatase [Rhizobiaceae bacterium]|nr:aryldialkylphosphatase [Rhizobiaceae bacterium]